MVIFSQYAGKGAQVEQQIVGLHAEHPAWRQPAAHQTHFSARIAQQLLQLSFRLWLVQLLTLAHHRVLRPVPEGCIVFSILDVA